MSFTREEKLAITAVILAALIGLGVMLYYMGIITFSGSGITGAVAGTNLPPDYTAQSAKFSTKQNVAVLLNLEELFNDPEGQPLTFMATKTEGVIVDLNENQLTITPEPGFTGDRVVTVFASDGEQVARKQLKIEVTGYTVDKKPEPATEPEPAAPQPAPEATPPAPETVPSPANETNASNETLPAPEQAPAQTEQPAAELPILPPATEQIAVPQQNIPKVEHEVEERLNNESEITAIVYFNESAVNESGLIVAQDSNDQRENWLAKKRAKVKAARELLIANLTPSGFTTSELGFKVVRQYETINAIAVKLTKSGLAKLNQSPNVLNIYSEKVLHIMLNQSVPLINAEDIWNMTLNNTKLNGMGVAVCIIDTGIDFGNPAFVNENAKIFGGYDFVNMDDHPQDDNGHGTHCAGIVGGNMTGGTGVSPNIGIVPVKVCDSGGSCPDVAVLAGIDYCIDHSAEFNISTISGSIGSGATYYSANCPTDTDAAFLIALAAGVTPVFAAGNWGVRPGVSWPSCSQYAISVGNVNKSNVISVSSNYGGDRFDVWAPGSNIYSAALGGGIVPMSGTSMATPHMGAVIAMIQYNLRLQSKPILSITQVHELLNTTGLVISDWRRIDVYAAILKLNANLTMNQSDNSITNVTANTTLKFKNDTNFDGFIQCGAISYNYVSIDSSLCPNLNKTAHIIFGNLSFVNATPTRNGQRCRPPICQNATYANGTLEFDVTEFSSYSSTEGNVNMDLIKLDSQDPVNASSYLNYTILINVTQGNASNITLTDLYPEQLIYLDSQPLPVPPTNNTFVIGNFTENQTILVNISLFVLNVSNNTQINNTANVSFQNDTSSWINASVSESTIILNQPLYNFTNISVNKTDSIDPVNASDYLNYTINMTLTGNGSAYNVTVNDTYPAQVIYQSSQPAPLAGTNNTWNWTSITNGTSILINITVFTRNVSNGTILNNTVNVACKNDTNDLMNFFSYAETTISSVFNVTNTSMLKIHSPDPINASSAFNYTINFTNTGTAVIYSLKINDTYPTPLTYISAQPSPDPGTNNYWTLGTFVPNATIIINISMSVPNLANGVMLNNTANATYQNDIGDIIPLTAQDNTPVNNPPNSCPVVINTSTTLNSNLNSGTSCITIGGNNLVLDCAGYQVTYNTGGGNSDYGIGADRKSNITIQNCVVIDNTGTGSYISGINFTKVNSSLIRNTVINSTGSSYTFGISLRDRDQNVTVTNVTIKTKGSSTYNFGVQMFNSTGNLIANSTILANSTSGSEVYGVLIDDYSQNNTIDNSTITADGTSNYNIGVYLKYTVSGNTISGSTIKAMSTATLAYSVYLNSNNYQMSQNKVINNNLTVNCSSTCYGVYVLYSSTNGIIENNTVNSAGRGSGNTNYGIFLWSSGGGGPGNYTIKNNTVRTYGIGDLNHGIHIWGNWNVNNNSVINNNIFPGGTGRANIGIYLIGASSTRVIGNNISTYGTQENHGIYVSSGSAACLIANNTVVTNGSAGYNYGLLAVAGGDNSTFADNNLTVRGIDSTGIYSETSQGNYFLNNQVNTSGSDGLMILGDNIVYFATNSIATTNTINGTPIYYYGGAGSSPACPNNQVLNSPNTNHIDFIGCNNVTLSNYAGSEGIILANSSNSTINYTVIRNTRYPVRLFFNSSYNNITYSNLTSNYSSGGYGVWIAYSAGNNLVSASNITTIGLATDNNYGVYIFGNASNNTITNSHISTNGSNYNYGVYLTLNANDNTVSNNLIRTKGSVQQNKGVYLYSYASGNSITNNTIITNGTNYDDGIHVYSYSNNNRLENNTINADGTDFVYGINVQTNSQNNTVKGNNITIYTPTTNIQTANGIYLQDLATKTTVDKNSILMYTYAMFNFEKNHGISVTNAHNNTITNNRVDTTGLFDFHIGIYLYSSSNNLFENNTVITGGRNYNHGIVTWGINSGFQCNNNTIKNNTILVNGTAGINYGVYEYQYNNKNDILGNRIITNCTYSCNGIYSPTSGSNAMIANNTIIASGTSGSTSNYGIYMYSGSNNNVIADNNISTTGPFSHGIQLIGSTNETLHNNNITIPALAMGLYIDVDSTTPDISQFMHTIDTQNTINGTPIYYYGGLGDSPACPNNNVISSPNAAHIDFIGCNNATLNGFTAFEPVTIVNATNSTVNNSRILNAYVGMRLFFNSTYNTISNCNITSENTTGSNYGILMHYWSSNNTIKNNNISVISGTTGNYGIYLFNSSKENNITNNFILVNGTSSNYGIYLQRMSSKNLVENNNVRLKGTTNANYGVYIYQSSEGNIIRNNTIRTNLSGSSQGIVLDTYASNNTVTGCTILEWNIYGLYVTTNSNNNTISHNNILLNNTNAGSAYCVYLNGPFSGTQVVENNITSNCSQNCWGIYAYNTVQNGIIANNTILTMGGNANNHGIYLNYEDTNNNISGNRINAMGRGIWVQTASQPNRFNDNSFAAVGDYAVYLQSATGSLFNNTFFDNSTYWLNSDASSRNNFTNTAFGTALARITILPIIQLNTTTIQWSQINASFNKTYINSTALPFFNTSGLVTLNGMTGSVATLKVDYDDDNVYEDCPSDVCVQQSFSGGTLVFNTTHFTGHSANTSEGPTSITTCPITINYTTTLTQSLVSNYSCITIGNSSVVLDCANFNVTYGIAGTNDVFGINITSVSNVTVQNCGVLKGNMSNGIRTNSILIGNATNVSIKYNRITAGGFHNNTGILANGTNLSTFIHNNITTNGTSSQQRGILLGSGGANNNISSNRISTNGSCNRYQLCQNQGIYFGSGRYDNTLISANTISTGSNQTGTTNEGIGSSAWSSDPLANFTISYNNISTGPNNSIALYHSGISMWDMPNSLVTGNTITIAGESNDGVFISSADNTTVSGNTVWTTLGTNDGIDVSGNNVTVSSNNIFSGNDEFVFGIRYTTTFSLIQNNNISVCCNGYNVGMHGYGHNTTILNNTIFMQGTTTNWGLYPWTNDSIINNTIRMIMGSDDNQGIRLESDNAFIKSNSITINGTSAMEGILCRHNCILHHNVIYANVTQDSYGIDVNRNASVIGNNVSLIGTTYNYGIITNIAANVHNNSIDMVGTNYNYGIDSYYWSNVSGNRVVMSSVTNDNLGISGYNNMTVDNNIIAINSSSIANTGINAGGAYEFSARNNNISVNGTNYNYGIQLNTQRFVNATGNIVSIIASGISNIGVYVGTTTRDAIIANNTVNTFGDSETHGIRLESELNGAPILIDNNTIRTNTSGTGGHGIALLDSGAGITAVTVNNNLIITDGTDSHGIFVSNASDLFTNNNITSLNGYSIMLAPGNSDVFGNNTLTNPANWIFAEPSTATYLENTTFQMPAGSITITPAVLLENGTNATKTNLFITYIYALLNSTNLSVLNTSAVITFESVVLTNPKPIVDYEDDASYQDCPPSQCVELGSYTPGGKYVYNTTHFTVYSASETSSGITGCPVTINQSTTLTQNLAADGDCITINNSNTVLECSGFSINGSGTGTGINATNLDNIIIRNCFIENFTTNIYVESVNNSRFLNNTARNSSVYSFWVDSSSNNLFANNTIHAAFSTAFMFTTYQAAGWLSNNTIRENAAEAAGAGIYMDSESVNATFINNTGTSTGSFGIYFYGTGSTVINNTGISTGSDLNYGGLLMRNTYGTHIDNTGMSSNSDGIRIRYGDYSNYTNNLGITNRTDDNFNGMGGIAIEQSTEIRFVNNTGISRGNASGIHVWRSSYNLIEANNGTSIDGSGIRHRGGTGNQYLNNTGTSTGGNGMTFEAGSFLIEAYNGIWQEAGIVHLLGNPAPGYRYSTSTITVPAGTTKVRITQAGTDTAHLDAVLLDSNAPFAVKDLSDSSSQPAAKLALADYDVINAVNRTIEIEWAAPGTSLAISGIEEDLNIAPMTWPGEGRTFSHTLGAPQLFTMYWSPFSKHPDGAVYAEFSTAPSALLLYIDVTPDNTLDYGGDWAELRVETPEGFRTFRMSHTQAKWGRSEYTYTDKVAWQHKTYNFTIPFSELGIGIGDEMRFRIGYYGTGGAQPCSSETIINNTGTSETGRGILVDTCTYTTLLWNNGTSISGSGIEISSGSENNLTESNGTSTSGTGILLSGTSANTLVQDNGRSTSGAGIRISSGTNNTLQYCNATSTSSYGIRLVSSAENNITSSTAESAGSSALSIIESDINAFKDNTFASNTGTAIYLEGGRASVQLFSDGFEDQTLAPFNTLGNADWNVNDSAAYTGAYSAMSGNITDDESSVLNITLNILEDATLSFARKISSEESSDYLTFYIDDIFQAQWSGEYDWEVFSYELSAGPHNLMWNYSKDSSGEAGADAAWIDDVNITTSENISQNNRFNDTILFTNNTWIFVGENNTGNTLERTLFSGQNGTIRIVPQVVAQNNTNASVQKLNISFNRAFLNSTNLSFLNTSAEIQLFSLSFASPVAYVDFEDDGAYSVCPPSICPQQAYSGGTFTFNVTQFTGYAAGETPISNLSNLTISKTDSPDPVNVSTNLTYQINVSVRGNGTAYNVTVNETYPLQVIYLTSQPSPVAGTNNSWVLGNLTQGANISINITVLVQNITNNTLINNTANATFQNESSALLSVFATENTTVLAPPVPPVYNFTNISITKTDYPDPVNTSNYLNYTINVTISGNGTAYNATVNETYPPQVIYISSQPAPVAGTNNSWVLGNLTATNITINITVLVQNITNNTLINNTVNATCTNETLALLRVSDTENTTVLAPPVQVMYNFSNMTIRKIDNPDPVNANSNLTYQINVSSTGNGTAYNVTVNDTYPPQTVYLTSSPTPVAGTNNSWALGNLTAGTNRSINITVLVLDIANGTMINNTANVTFQNETGAVLLYGNFAETLVLNPPRFNLSNITITKTGVPNPVAPGGQLNYTITVTSSGNDTAYNVTVNETYPEQVIYLSSQPTPFAGTNNSWMLGNLTPGTVILLNITVNVSESTANGTVINNTVNLTFNNETGELLGRNAGTSTNVSNLTPTPTPPGPSGGGGGSGGGGIGGVRRNTTTAPVQQGCVENWECGEWTACIDNSQSRSCIEANGCTNPQFAPQTQRSCQPQKPAQEEQPAELPSGIQHSALPAQQPLEFPGENSVISAIAKPIINLFKAYLWPIVFIIIALLLLTAGYVVFTHRKPEEMQQMPQQIQMPEEPEEMPEPRLPAILPRMPKSDKKFYQGIDAKLADINKKLASLDKTNKKLEKKLKKK